VRGIIDMKEISILGSTGSVGRQTLEVVRHNPDEFKVVGIASRFSRDILIEQIREFSPRVVSVLNSEEKEKLEEMTNDLKIKPEIVCGLPGLIKVSTMPEVKMVVVAVVGLVGLVPTLKAIEYRKDIALATKEVMVIAGKIVKQALKRFKVNLIPIDSEHSAIFQCLKGEAPDHIKEIILTCSGGPFRQKTKEELEKVTVKEALRHPNWKMGQKITIASATLMNKGLEILEAKWLFDVKLEQIEVIIHPQSIIHSMVELKD
jgi:1-deoxy-D-xylulose-5-phosphate reductoisomerase